MDDGGAGTSSRRTEPPVTHSRAHSSPTAFRRALTDRLKENARTGRWTLPQLQRHFACDRLLERLYLVDDGWVVKGAVALLARGIGVRATAVIDVYRDTAREVAEAALRDAANRDTGDWFNFEIGAGRPMDVGAKGLRVPVTAYLGPTVWVAFHVDLVGSDLRMTGEPEDVPPLARIVNPDVEQHGYRAYPLVDHIADKVVAMFQRYGTTEAPSTRFKDLVDLVAITTQAPVDADPMSTALTSEAARRGIALPLRFDVPDRALWQRGYVAEANRSLLAVAHTLVEALKAVGPFADPLLDGSACGRWQPISRRWATTVSAT